VKHKGVFFHVLALLTQISSFFSAFHMRSSNRIFMFVSGMFENYTALVHSDVNRMELSAGFLQPFLLTV